MFSKPHRSLYLGLEVARQWKESQRNQTLIHCPIIQIEECSLDQEEMVEAFQHFAHCNYLILTSKVAVRLFFNALFHFGYSERTLKKIVILAIGAETAKSIESFGVVVSHVAANETSEGMTKLLHALDLTSAHFFYPCSALARPVIANFFKQRDIPFHQIPLYTTVTRSCKEEILQILPIVDELIFTSPSTVNAYIELFQSIPWDKKISSIGPITANHLNKMRDQCLID
jgi:uroporphyrinogen-III synthase